jgi:hypothetical protein
MKTVFSSTEALTHVWANQSQSVGRANSTSFNEGVFFSYATAIAELCTGSNGEKIALINSYSYSNTTAKHQSLVHRAINGDYKIISGLHFNRGAYGLNSLRSFGQLDFNVLALLNERRASEFLLKASKARTRKDLYQSQALSILKAIEDYASAFGFTYELKQDLAALELAAKNAKIAADEAQKQAKLARIEKQKEDLQAWRDGSGYGGYFEVTALRINHEKQTIETSRRAEIPLSLAPRIWAVVSDIHSKGEEVTNINCKITSYVLNWYKNGEFGIGCHTIAYSEFELIAKQLGYI